MKIPFSYCHWTFVLSVLLSLYGIYPKNWDLFSAKMIIHFLFKLSKFRCKTLISFKFLFISDWYFICWWSCWLLPCQHGTNKADYNWFYCQQPKWFGLPKFLCSTQTSLLLVITWPLPWKQSKFTFIFFFIFVSS